MSAYNGGSQHYGWDDATVLFTRAKHTSCRISDFDLRLFFHEWGLESPTRERRQFAMKLLPVWERFWNYLQVDYVSLLMRNHYFATGWEILGLARMIIHLLYCKMCLIELDFDIKIKLTSNPVLVQLWRRIQIVYVRSYDHKQHLWKWHLVWMQ